MKDIDLAKKIILETNAVIVIVKNEEVIFSSIEKGIKPLFDAYKKLGSELKGSSVVDKVTGRAAAIICKYSGVYALHSKTISEGAVKILMDSDILFTFETKVEFIMNRNRSGLCPVEKLSQSVYEGEELLNKIAIFLNE